MKQITFLHAADLHLDSPMVGLTHLPDRILKRVRESTFVALQKLTRTAIEKEVDFVILAGDLFDGEDRSLRAQSRLRNEMKKLEEKGIAVYVIHGNHDHLSGTWINLDLPENVHVFSSEVETKTLITKSGVSVNLYGFSYPERHVYSRKIDDYKKVEGADYHIGILHGNEGGRSEHGNYAPFHVQDLLEKQFDYWALGHIHKRAVLSENPPVIYPGNIQGRNKKETGEKGFYLVTLSELNTELEFVESSDVIWAETVIDAGGMHSFQDVYHLCQASLSQYRKNGAGTLLTIFLKNVQLQDVNEKQVLDGELLEILQEEEQDEESFVWIADIQIDENMSIDQDCLKNQGEFYKELFTVAENYDQIKEALDPLYHHKLARKYLASLSASDQEKLLEKAGNLLIKLLYPS